jgi:hypothetical protein
MYAGQNPVSGVDPLGLYEQSGHFWTTYESALAYGADEDVAYVLACYSQLPDQIERYDSIGLANCATRQVCSNMPLKGFQNGPSKEPMQDKLDRLGLAGCNVSQCNRLPSAE